MNASIGNWYKVLNQVLSLIKLPGQYQLKIIHVFFYKIHRMVEIWSTRQYDTLCRNLHGFPAMEKNLCTAQEILVNYHQLSFAVSLYC